jgi:hypothetical protein
MAEPVKIPFANAEFQVFFERPHIAFIGRDWTRAFEEVFAALSDFNLLLTDVEIMNTGKLVDHKAIFRLPSRGISFQFGAEGYRYSKERPSWVTTEADEQIILAAERALMDGSDAKIASCIATVTTHIQPLTKSREEILTPFISEPFKMLMRQRQTRSYATNLLFEDGTVLIDFSMVFANGIFLRFSSSFNGHPPLSEMLAKLRDDRAALFGILGVEEEINA